MVKLKIDIIAGVVEVEGEIDFVREIYKDFKELVKKPPIENSRFSAVNKDSKEQPFDSEADPKKKKRGGSNRGTPDYIQELADKLDTGKVKLTDFFKERKASSGFETNTIFVYFLEKEFKQSKINVNHIYTCYKLLGIKSPGALRQNLADTAFKKLWINTASMEDIRVTGKGENLVLHELTKGNEK